MRQAPLDTLPLFSRKSAVEDVCRNFHGGADTSEAAIAKHREHLTALQTIVLRHVELRGEKGATIDEATINLDRPWQSVGARFSELVRDGHLIRLQATRDSSRGNPSHIHVTRETWERMGRPVAVERRGSRRRQTA